MNSIAHRSGFSRRDFAAVVACLTLAACAPRDTPRASVDLPARLRFTNATPDHVTVYLALASVRPFRLGEIDGFRTAVLPLPFFESAHNAGSARLLVVPLGASKTGRATLQDLEGGAWTSLTEPLEEMVNTRWTLVGQQLFSTPRHQP